MICADTTFSETFAHLYDPADLAAFLLEAYAVEAMAADLADPAKALWLSAGEHAVFSDNLLDVLPGEVVEITVKDPELSPIRVVGLHSLFALPAR